MMLFSLQLFAISDLHMPVVESVIKPLSSLLICFLTFCIILLAFNINICLFTDGPAATKEPGVGGFRQL